MDLLWLLRGERTEPGWKELEQDSRAEAVDLVIFDRDAGFALVRAADPPDKYQGLVPGEPADGLYVSEQGQPIYVVSRAEVRTAEQLIDALGDDAKALLAQLRDPIRVLQRLGRAF
jgi:hypothetical protein